MSAILFYNEIEYFKHLLLIYQFFAA